MATDHQRHHHSSLPPPPPPIRPAVKKALLSDSELEAAIPAVLGLASAHFFSQCFYTVVSLGVPDVIGAGTLSFREIVSSLECRVNEDLLLRQMRAVASKGVLMESTLTDGGGEHVAGGPGDAEGENNGGDIEYMYSLSPVGKLLQTGVAAPHGIPSMACGVKHRISPQLWSAWGKLSGATYAGGDIPFCEVTGMMLFDFIKANPAYAQVFNEFMNFLTISEIKGITQSYDWSVYNGKTICDVGGGLGETAAMLKAKYPEINMLCFDLPEVIESIRESNKPNGVEFVKGDFFDPSTVPTCDLAFLKHIFHDWSDEDSSKILRSLHSALPPHAKLMVVNCVLPGPGEDICSPLNTERLQYNCYMAIFGGKERTLAEWKILFSGNGWSLEEVAMDASGGPLCCLITVVKEKP